jgi:hypothetical protein
MVSAGALYTGMVRPGCAGLAIAGLNPVRYVYSLQSRSRIIVERRRLPLSVGRQGEGAVMNRQRGG